jgi:hypothetical protein
LKPKPTCRICKKNRNRVEKGRWFTRYLIVNKKQQTEEISETINNAAKIKAKKAKNKTTR